MPRLTRRSNDPSPPTRALRDFLATEVAGGLVLVAATVVALVWANSPWRASYDSVWHTSASVALGRFELALDLRHWVNDGLMAIFFLVVGLEVKRELLLGELRDPRRAALPVVAAVGGMVVPALLFLAANPSGEAGRGWGIPMATDIAFALGALALVARALPSSLRLFLLTLAIVDDIGAIVVIAIFYSSDLDLGWLVAAVAVLGFVGLARRVGLVATPLFGLLGVLLWLALHASGVHATLAGVAVGLMIPATPTLNREIVRSRADELIDVFSPEAARQTTRMARQSVSQLEWVEHALHGWSSLAIVPLFALANAGVHLSSDRVGDAAGSSVTAGVVLGLVVGKPLGITAAAWLATRTRLCELPDSVTWRQVVGVATLAGIGFTVSLFITSLAFDDPTLADDAKVGILAASILATALGAVLLRAKPHARGE